LRALITLLDIDTLYVAQGALRHGVLFEMVEREDHSTDTRDLSAKRLANKFEVDVAQAHRVGDMALHWLNAMHVNSNIEDAHLARLRRKLGWAAQLHEVGTAISHSDYHKHGAYILDNADMVGFSVPELHLLGLLVLGQRGKLKKLELELEDNDFAKMLLALRLSLIMCHARKDPTYQVLVLQCDERKQRITLTAPATWVREFPQSTHLLKLETTAWQKTPWSFDFVTNP
jgi:exopolyphosphatase/guanosine-5'-triphosphate,3'-diphosphate pyrophosphatase